MNTLPICITQLLTKRAFTEGSNIAYRILSSNCEERVNITYAELEEKVNYLAGTLNSSIQAGDRVILMFDSADNFIYSFYACLKLGAIAVPLKALNKREPLERLKNVYEDCSPSILLADNKTYKTITETIISDSFFGYLNVINIEESVDHYKNDQFTKPFIPDVNIQADQTAFIQYTSGSTGKPKGVMVSHANIMSNSEMIRCSFGYSDKTIMVSWLPLFHDMGLIGGIIQPLYTGFSCILMSPISFIQHPMSWLKIISKYRATTAGAPNFAYDLCIFGYRENALEHLDLGSLTLLFNGAEPVKYSTLEQFSILYEKFGFNKNAFTPCYGMAEATLLIASKIIGQPYKHIDVCTVELENNYRIKLQSGINNSGTKIISAGKPVDGLDIIIISDENNIKCLPSHQIGQIAVNGTNVTSGYWGMHSCNSEKFIKTNDHNKYFLTGDLGFIFEGELYIIGRVDDMMIINGRNIYPDGIEHKIEQLSSIINKNGVVCFQTKNGIVILVEVISKNLDTDEIEILKNTIHALLSNEFNITIKELHFVRKRSIPKTSSGKKMRKYCRNQFNSNPEAFLNDLSLKAAENA